MDLTLVPYQHTSPSLTHHHDHHHARSPDSYLVKYKECMRNHAASIGRHANDGCGEFMPRGDDGTLDCLTCAACGCHRNFHRREGFSSLHYDHHQQVFSYNAVSGKKHLMASYFDDGDDIDDHDRRSETPEREKVNVVSGVRAAVAAAGGAKSKRFRTKFTQEQKDRMMEFAEKIGWRINKHDDVALNHFCNEVGVKRSVLKVWIHNNKNAHRRRDAAVPASALAAPPPPPLPPAPPQTAGI